MRDEIDASRLAVNGFLYPQRTSRRAADLRSDHQPVSRHPVGIQPWRQEILPYKADFVIRHECRWGSLSHGLCIRRGPPLGRYVMRAMKHWVGSRRSYVTAFAGRSFGRHHDRSPYPLRRHSGRRHRVRLGRLSSDADDACARRDRQGRGQDRSRSPPAKGRSSPSHCPRRREFRRSPRRRSPTSSPAPTWASPRCRGPTAARWRSKC